MNFLKNSLCSYPNAVSKTYMADIVVRFLTPCMRIFILGTQCCELMATAFQLLESEKDAANFGIRQWKPNSRSL